MPALASDAVVTMPRASEVRSQYVHDVQLLLCTLSGLAAAIRSRFLPLEPVLNCISQMKRSMLGIYCTIWSQQKPPSAVLSNTVVGSRVVKVLPPSKE